MLNWFACSRKAMPICSEFLASNGDTCIGAFSTCIVIGGNMSTEDSITLEPRKYGKLGVVHCGVTREGFIAVAGDPRDIADGEEIIFDKAKVSASRKGSSYTFTRLG